jgi:hypothetical protein
MTWCGRRAWRRVREAERRMDWCFIVERERREEVEEEMKPRSQGRSREKSHFQTETFIGPVPFSFGSSSVRYAVDVRVSA